jgi:hypothetical protein
MSFQWKHRRIRAAHVTRAIGRVEARRTGLPSRHSLEIHLFHEDAKEREAFTELTEVEAAEDARRRLLGERPFLDSVYDLSLHYYVGALARAFCGEFFWVPSAGEQSTVFNIGGQEEWLARRGVMPSGTRCNSCRVAAGLVKLPRDVNVYDAVTNADAQRRKKIA